MPKTPEEMMAAIVRNLPEKTGKSLDQWIEILRTDGPQGPRKERVAYMKQVHGLGHVQAQVVVDVADKPADAKPKSPEEMVNEQYAGPKAHLRPILDRILAAVRDFGPDLSIEPRNTYVSLNRNRQIAYIQPATRTRVDVYLCLPNTEAAGRLQPANLGPGERRTHKVALTSAEEVDAELIGWLKQAYLEDAPRS